MPAPLLTPATLAFDNGVPYAQTYGDVYHSADGGLDQARHVFIGGNRLLERWQGRDVFSILETGFGLGLNFLATWQAWRGDGRRPGRLHYVAIEKHPFYAQDLARLHAQWPELGPLSAELCANWPLLVPGIHRRLLDGGRVVLTLVFSDIADALPQLGMRADAFYLDGFAPSRNPEMWAEPLLARLNRLATPGATAATYTVSAPVRQALVKAGFHCEKKPGFGRKREMLSASYAPRWTPPPVHLHAVREAIVIGAGVAGSAACMRLAERGWRVTLLERHGRPAQEASGNLAAIAMPLLSRDDNLASRLSRAAYFFSLHMWDRLGGIGKAFDGHACGVLQLANDSEHAFAQRKTIEEFRYPQEFVQWLDPAAVLRLSGNANTSGGWLFPRAGWVRPASLCEAMLAACGDRLERRFSQEVAKLEKTSEGWAVRDRNGVLLGQAPVVVIASGAEAGGLEQTKELPLSRIRGQVTHVPEQALPNVNVVLCGKGYLTPAVKGMRCLGASYDFDDDPEPRQSSHDQNLAHLETLLGQSAPHPGLAIDGRVGFRCTSPDRMPLIGALPDQHGTIRGTRLRDVPRLPGLYGLLAYGSRGIVWAPFAAELLASLLEGEPLPIENELAAAVDPARFLLKAYRKGT